MTNNWLLLRGLARGNAHWGVFPEILKQKHPNFEIELIEIPGNGTRFAEKTPTNPITAIELLRNNKFTNSGQPLNICAMSLGGMLALKWAELYPDEIQSLIIINSSLKQLSPFYERLRYENYYKILTAFFRKDLTKQEITILQLTSNKSENILNFIDNFSKFSKEHPISKINFLRQLILASSVYIHKPIKIPIKIIVSIQDRLVHSNCSKDLAKFLKSELINHETAGHDLPLDEPYWLADHF